MDEQIGGTSVTDDQIRQRAYEISLGEDSGTADENWRRAEQEIRGGGDPGASGGADVGIGGVDVGVGEAEGDLAGGDSDLTAGDAPMADVSEGGYADIDRTEEDAAPEAGDQPSEDLPGAASP